MVFVYNISGVGKFLYIWNKNVFWIYHFCVVLNLCVI